ncbi:glycosyltransferase [Pseudorhizobium endolithicum]|uniref:Glycosyltransferase n=1 Tax=Pseudorhizobium endolithicum TaxID=1191678 RepID=A0ABN7JLB8_9HYPH|nr:glycosyl transferase family protein [Pseudorhizobium endolithicum]CAD7030953.1 glycosyltransferase [Pseudorhizobium endolithicum]
MAEDGGQLQINRTKLLLVLDALLREGSVTGAAASLEMQVSSVSRMLGDLRELYGDPIFIRTGRGLKPTPFAETLRLRVRAVSEEVNALMRGEGWKERDTTTSAPAQTPQDGWQRRSIVLSPPLAATRGDHLEAEPTSAVIARQIASIGDNADPQRRLAKYIALTSPGPGRSRPLEAEEARDALAIILRGEADPVQIGALLSTVQYRGPTAVELAGFTRAVREAVPAGVGNDLGADLDWPAYVSPRWRSPPWFMHAAKLVAGAGHRVLMHGHFGNGADSGKLEEAAERASIPICVTAAEASAALASHGIAYMPLAALVPQVTAMFNLHPLFGTRTPLHNVAPLINPVSAPATIVGAPGGASRFIYRDVAKLLGMESMTMVTTIRSFAQITPTRATTVMRMMEGEDISVVIPARPALGSTAAPTSGYTQREYWQAVWSGAARDELAEATVIYTAATALFAVSRESAARFEDSLRRATELWASRKR